MNPVKVSVQKLTEEELLAAFLPKDSAKQLLWEYSSLYHILVHTSAAQLQAIPDIGREKAKKIGCMREVWERVQQERVKPAASISGPSDVMQYFRFLEDRQQEELWVLLLDTKNHILKKEQITIGMATASLASPRELFHAAVRQMATTVISVHSNWRHD